MNISMDKKYTMDGEDFTILTTTLPGSWPVAGHDKNGALLRFDSEGHFLGCLPCLVDVSPCADFVIDEPVMVRDRNMDQWLKRYFAGVAPDGSPSTFSFGSTKWSNEGDANVSWLQCRRPTAQELAT